MLQEKRHDLDAEKRKQLVQRLVAELSRLGGDLYYQPTSQIALQIRNYAAGDAKLTAEEKALLAPLSQRDIEVLLSLH
ncbi:MAG: hypothetical protein RDA78_13510 [Roseibium sp.]|uniref:hypothetical protein n=1 Tax=Roseibium sp. TaxID=1936156 RepID=UPI003D9C10EA